MNLRDLFPRLATGAFILNSGLSKRGGDEETAQGLQGFAAGTYPKLGEMEPKDFLSKLSTGEIVVGSTLLLPFVPNAIAGGALVGFSSALLGLYLKTPGMRKEGSLAPTQDGLSLAKDVWMFGIGLGMLADALTKDD